MQGIQFEALITCAAFSSSPRARYVCPMLKRFLPAVINCWDESVLPARALNFVSASLNLPSSIKETPSFQIVNVSTMDISAIFDPFARVLTKKELQPVFEKENRYSKHLTPAVRIYIFKRPENRGRIYYNKRKFKNRCFIRDTFALQPLSEIDSFVTVTQQKFILKLSKSSKGVKLQQF